jgi:hypothetical protein
MKSKMWVAAMAAGCVWLGCPDELCGQSAASDLVASYHFAGAERLSNLADNATLQKVLALPETRQFAGHFLDRLAQASSIPFPRPSDPSEAEKIAALLRPLLADLTQRESFLEARKSTGPTSMLLGVALTSEQAARWQTNLAALANLWKLGTPVATESSAGVITTVKSADGRVTRWLRSGDWLVIGTGGDKSEDWDRALAGLKQSKRPKPELSSAWLATELDLPRLSGALGLSGKMVWPQVSLTASGRDEDVRIASKLVFGEDVTGPLEPWRVPTNIIREPLIGFTAWRGTRPLLSRSETLGRLGWSPPPNQVYFWAQSLTAPQTLVAFPATDPTNRVRAMLKPALELVPESWRERGLAQIEWQEDRQHLVWQGLPLLYPHFRGAEEAGQGYVTGGSFPALQTTNAPPDEMLRQFVGKPGLLYYHWEISARRLPQLRLQVQLAGMVAGKKLMLTNSPALRWLEELEQHLGNSATEIVAVSPREWSLTRRAPIGLTAAEVVALTCWVDSLEFPRLTLKLPDRSAPSPAAAPAVKR